MPEENFMATYLPYCLERIETGEYVVVPAKFTQLCQSKVFLRKSY